MASNTDKINLTDLQELLGSDLTGDFKIMVFTDSGQTYQMSPTGISCINSLDTAYDGCGSGAGREIIADSGAVKISGEDGLLVTGAFGSGATIEYVGAEDFSVMYFNPRKAAFRAGNPEGDGDQWDDANVGDNSVAIGYGGKASGENSTAFGNGTIASGNTSTAIGSTTTASGDISTSMGSATTASGNTSTAIGEGTTAESYAETSIGIFNTDYTPISTDAWNATDRLFVIGNGQNSGTRADALIIQKNGNLTMPTTTGAFSPPVMTTTQRDALTPTAGMMVYNSTTNKHQGYDGSTWNDFY